MDVDPTQMTRVRYIRAVLEWHGDSPADLAGLLGVSRDMAYKKLLGARAFTIPDLVKIADKYGLDGNQLLRPDPAVLAPALGLLPCTYRYLRWSEPLFTKALYQTFPLIPRVGPFVADRLFTSPCRVSNFRSLPRGGQVRPRSERWSGG